MKELPHEHGTYMVRYDDIVHAGVYRGIGVLDRLDALEY
jgi:hypothetical protein